MIVKNKNNNSVIGTIYFIHQHLAKEWPDLIGNKNPGVSGDYIHRYKNGRDGWIITTYLELLNRGYDVELSESFVPGKICVAHQDHIRVRKSSVNSYIISIKADRALTYTCENEIVQSPSSLSNRSDYYIPYWPQSNIIARDVNRGPIIENIVYMGRERNLAACFRDESFHKKLNNIGVTLKVVNRSNWHNYYNADLVIAIRDGSDDYLKSKPANKLVNAWIARVPSIVGHEPAFKALWRSELDYFTAKTQEDVLSIIKKLKASPTMYTEMIHNAKIRSTEFTFEAISQYWENCLFHGIVPSYLKWQKKQKMLWGCYPLIEYWIRNINRLIFSREYRRGFDYNTGNRLTITYRLKRKFRQLVDN